MLRPSRIHGVGAARPLEWVFVTRALDKRRHLLLANEGRGINHPTAAVNLAALVELCATNPGTRILNSADPDAPDGLTISRIVAAHLGHAWSEVLLDATAPDGLGDHPWNTVPPVVLDTTAAEQLGFVPVRQLCGDGPPRARLARHGSGDPANPRVVATAAGPGLPAVLRLRPRRRVAGRALRRVISHRRRVRASEQESEEVLPNEADAAKGMG